MDLVESQTVLNRDEDQDITGMVRFQWVDEDNGHVVRELLITEADDTDFGSPDMVTITITPGDTLNGTPG